MSNFSRKGKSYSPDAYTSSADSSWRNASGRVSKPYSLTQRELADAIHVPYQRINDIVHGRRKVTPSTALRLAKFFNMSADFWINLQMRWDMFHAQQEETAILKKIEPVRTP